MSTVLSGYCTVYFDVTESFQDKLRKASVDKKVVYLDASSTELLTEFQACVHCALYVTLQTATKVTEHGGTSGKHYVLADK